MYRMRKWRIQQIQREGGTALILSQKARRKKAIQKHANKNNSAKTTTTSPNHSSPTTTKKYPSRPYWTPNLPNTPSTITHLNLQATPPVRFGNERLNITIIITFEH